MRASAGRLATVVRAGRMAIPYAGGAVLKHIVSTPVLARWYWSRPRATSVDTITRTLSALVRLRRLRGRHADDCLESALLLYRELSKAGRSPLLVLGLRRTGGVVTGHAWVEIEGRPVAEREENVRDYSRIAAYGERGRAVAVDR